LYEYLKFLYWFAAHRQRGREGEGDDDQHSDHLSLLREERLMAVDVVGVVHKRHLVVVSHIVKVERVTRESE
jgi:hypothetical protein